METIKEIIMQGKERDIKLAQSFRETFIDEYNDTQKFSGLVESLGADCVDRLIFRLKRDEKIDFYKDYLALKEIAAKVKTEQLYKVFLKTCAQNEARAWINDNGKWKGLVFEALYKVFREDENLKQFISA